MKGLLDGDIVVFRCGFAAERTQWHLAWGPDDERRGWNHTKSFDYKRDALDELDKILPGKYSRVQGEDYDLWPEKMLEPLSHALQGVKTLVTRVCESLDLDPGFDLEVFLSDGRNFRHEVAKTRPYKGTRKEEHRPTYEQEIREYIKKNYDTYTAVDEEADDLMGIHATKYGPEESIIITLDKDLDMIPGLHYNWVKDVAYKIGEREAMHNFHVQLMTGDTTDNIPGLTKIGPAKAAKALHGCDSDEEELIEVVRQYQIHSGKEDWLAYLREQGQLLWIRRHPDEMWEPHPAAVQPMDLINEGDLTLEVD